MIVWWTGRGFWALPILFLSVAVPVLAATLLFVSQPENPMAGVAAAMAPVVGFGTGGRICRQLGKQWNEHARIHTLYSVSVETWGALFQIISVLLAGVMAVALAYRFLH